MFQTRRLQLLAGATLGLCVISSVVLGGVDWLGQCWDGKNQSSKTKVPAQKCMNLTNCFDNTTSDCTRIAGICKSAPGKSTVAEEERVIQYGQCTSWSNQEACWFCDGKKLICHVVYNYQMVIDGNCVSRCPEPEMFTTTDKVDACKP